MSDRPDTWVISGLLVNKSLQTATSVEVEFSIFDPSGNVLEVKTIQLSALQFSPQEGSPFQIEVHNDLVPHRIHVTAVGYQPMLDDTRIQFEAQKLEMGNSLAGETAILGLLTNPTDQWALVMDSYAISIDAEAEVIDLDIEPNTYTVLPPKGSEPFLTHLHPALQGEILLYADGQPIDPPPVLDLEYPQSPVLLQTAQGKPFLLGSIQNPNDSALDVILHFQISIEERLIGFATYTSNLPLAPSEIRLYQIDLSHKLIAQLKEEFNLGDASIQLDIDRGTAISNKNRQPLMIEVIGIESTGSTLLLQCSITNPSTSLLLDPTLLIALYQTNGQPLSAAEVKLDDVIQAGDILQAVIDFPLPPGTDLTLTEFDFQASGLLP